jgi:hypothetical protein
MNILVGLLKLTLFLALVGIQKSPTASQDAPLGELFRLSVSSDYVAIGTVTKARLIAQRVPEKKLAPGELIDLGDFRGELLYTFHVENLLCARTDFEPGVPRPEMEGEDFYIFKKKFIDNKERYNQNERYLLFLTPVPNQDQLLKELDLEQGRTYYEAFEGKRGLIPLPDDNLPLLDKLKQVCEAVSPADPQEKLERLKALANSSDPELRQSAKEAMWLIKERMP